MEGLIKETLDAVLKINARANNEYTSGMFFPLVFSTDGDNFKVEFLGHCIFTTEDEREKEQSVEDFLIKEIRSNISALFLDINSYGKNT